MSTALYRRYRPDSFAEMIGQEHVTVPLMQALRSNRVNHAYLFSGPRGCGKTTSARILARILNCAQNTEANPTDTPCGQCPSCIELARGGTGSLDVVEIDAASHGGVDDARDLRERATFSPTRDRFKIFILDEAHMVTAQGFNALLKIVEEPPPYLKFIFATTEPDKVIGTIRSRTHHYPFKLVAPETMNGYLEQLCAAEGIIARNGVLPLVVRAGGGSVRDTLSVLDQLIAGASGGVLEYDQAVALLGFTPATLLDEVVQALGSRDGGALFRVVEQVVQTGHEPRRFVEDLLERLRDLVVISLTGEAASAVLPGVPADQLSRMQSQAEMLGVAELSRSADVVNAALTEMSGATSPRLHLELLCARLLLPAADSSASGLGARIDGIERAIASGTPLAGGAPVSRSSEPHPGSSGHGAPNVSAQPTSETGPSQVAANAGERKSLRPDSTRRKPATSENNAGVGGVSNGQGQGAQAQQGGAAAPGSMFASSAPTGIFGAPATPAAEPEEPQVSQGGSGLQGSAQTQSMTQQSGQPVAQQAPPASQPQQAQQAQAQQAQAQQAQPQPSEQPASVQQQAAAAQQAAQATPDGPAEPQLPEQVGAYQGPRDDEGRPVAANTGWHTAGSRQPQAAANPSTPPQVAEAAPQPQRAESGTWSQEAAPQARVPESPAQQPPAQAQQVQTQQVPPRQQPSDAVPSQAPQSAQPAQPSAAQNNETEVFKQRWPEIVDALNGMSRATGALIGQHATVEHLDSQTLYLGFPNENLLRPFSARQGDNLVAAAVKNVLGFDVQVVADVQGSPRFPKAGSSADTAVAAPTPAPTPEVSESQVSPSQGWASQSSEPVAPATQEHGAQSAEPSTVSASPASVSTTPASGELAGTEQQPLPPLSSQWETHATSPQDDWNVPAPSGTSAGPDAPSNSNAPTGLDAPDNGDPVMSATTPVSAGSPNGSASATSAGSPSGPETDNGPSTQATGPAPFDPQAAVSIFGAAVGAFANAQANPAPVVPKLGETTNQIVENLATQRRSEPAATAPVTPPPARNAGAEAPTYDDFPPEPPADDWGAPEHQGSAPDWNSPASSGPSADSASESAGNARVSGSVSAGSPATATPAGSVPPWEETPRQAAARRAAELAAREAERQQIEDDPQPDDEDLESSNLVGVPLVKSMFGATVIDELTDEA